jgi:hypothetical protein
VPPGCLFHWGALTDRGLRVTDVRETKKQFQHYAQENIGPYSQQVGIPGPPRITFYEVHNYQGEALAAGELAQASDVMMAHPLALQLRNLQTLVEISVDKNSTVILPAPLMSTILELGAFLKIETQASGDLPAPPVPTTVSGTGARLPS